MLAGSITLLQQRTLHNQSMPLRVSLLSKFCS
jgi:hypothetical protein